MSVRRYPTTAYDREMPDGPDSWELTVRDIPPIEIGRELLDASNSGLGVHGGPLRKQLPDGSQGPEDGTAVTVIWGSNTYADGTRRVLGWYESSREG